MNKEIKIKYYEYDPKKDIKILSKNYIEKRFKILDNLKAYYENISLVLYKEGKFYYLDPNYLFYAILHKNYSLDIKNLKEFVKDIKPIFNKNYKKTINQFYEKPIEDLIFDTDMTFAYKRDYLSSKLSKRLPIISLKDEIKKERLKVKKTQNTKKIINSLTNKQLKTKDTISFNVDGKEDIIYIYDTKKKELNAYMVSQDKKRLIYCNNADYKALYKDLISNYIKLEKNREFSRNIVLYKKYKGRFSDKINIKNYTEIKEELKNNINFISEDIIISDEILLLKGNKYGGFNYMMKIENDIYIIEPSTLFKALIKKSKYQNHKELKLEYADFVKKYQKLIDDNIKNIAENNRKYYISYLNLKNKKITESEIITPKLLMYERLETYIEECLNINDSRELTTFDIELNDYDMEYVAEKLIPEYAHSKNVEPLYSNKKMYMENNIKINKKGKITKDIIDYTFRHEHQSYELNSNSKLQKINTCYDDFLKIMKG